MLRDVKMLQPRMVIDTFSPKPAYGVKSGILQINTHNKDENCIKLRRTVILAPNTGTHLFSTMRAAENGVFNHFEAENCLIANGKKIGLRKSPDRFKAYLDGTIARKPTSYIASQVRKFDQYEDDGSACTATTAFTWHRRLGHPHSGEPK